ENNRSQNPGINFIQFAGGASDVTIANNHSDIGSASGPHIDVSSVTVTRATFKDNNFTGGSNALGGDSNTALNVSELRGNKTDSNTGLVNGFTLDEMSSRLNGNKVFIQGTTPADSVSSAGDIWLDNNG
ncbi:hypothetical protein, partial [Haloterrigena gelatinilytica]|uniref:hypothetical protein n=1 Tax=Haloterrigena gelatinilytica TaxID=2741724 RepID=UPI001C2E0C83